MALLLCIEHDSLCKQGDSSLVKDNLALELPVMKLINNIEHGQNPMAKLFGIDCSLTSHIIYCILLFTPSSSAVHRNIVQKLNK